MLLMLEIILVLLSGIALLVVRFARRAVAVFRVESPFLRPSQEAPELLSSLRPSLSLNFVPRVSSKDLLERRQIVSQTALEALFASRQIVLKDLLKRRQIGSQIVVCFPLET
jgi:hypothetical protein